MENQKQDLSTIDSDWFVRI